MTAVQPTDGLSSEALSRDDLDVQDPDYPVIIPAHAYCGEH
jgi:hypothetical protein